MAHLYNIFFLVQSQSFVCFWVLTAHYIKMCREAKGPREDREMSNDVWLFLWLHSVWSSPSLIFVLCMYSFLTRSRGNAHSSSSSICSVNSLWVITSLFQFLNSPIILLSSLFWCSTPSFCVNCWKEHDGVYEFLQSSVFTIPLECHEYMSVIISVVIICFRSTAVCLRMMFFQWPLIPQIPICYITYNIIVHSVCVHYVNCIAAVIHFPSWLSSPI